MRTLKLTIEHLPDPELSPNARIHWRVKAQAVRIARAEVGWLAKAEWHSEKPMPRAVVSYEFTVTVIRLRDQDNFITRCKAWQDGLIDAGILVFDDSKHLKIGSVSFIKGDKNQTVITVQELEE